MSSRPEAARAVRYTPRHPVSVAIGSGRGGGTTEDRRRWRVEHRGL